MFRTVPALVMTAMAVFPIGGAWAASGPATAALHARITAPKAKATTHKYKRPSVDMRWGPVQVTISVKSKKITNVSATAPTERSRSAFINDQALPLLRQEVLSAQSANIDAISGATMTSDAYAQSLQGAMAKAHLPTS